MCWRPRGQLAHRISPSLGFANVCAWCSAASSSIFCFSWKLATEFRGFNRLRLDPSDKNIVVFCCILSLGGTEILVFSIFFLLLTWGHVSLIWGRREREKQQHFDVREKHWLAAFWRLNLQPGCTLWPNWTCHLFVYRAAPQPADPHWPGSLFFDISNYWYLTVLYVDSLGVANGIFEFCNLFPPCLFGYLVIQLHINPRFFYLPSVYDDWLVPSHSLKVTHYKKPVWIHRLKHIWWVSVYCNYYPHWSSHCPIFAQW